MEAGGHGRSCPSRRSRRRWASSNARSARLSSAAVDLVHQLAQHRDVATGAAVLADDASQSFFFSWVSVDFPCISQCTSRPATTRVSKSFDSASSARLAAAGPPAGTSRSRCRRHRRRRLRRPGPCAARPAVRTKVVTSKPYSASRAAPMRRSNWLGRRRRTRRCRC